MVPLAYLTQDSRIIQQIEKYIDYILDHQTSDGWLGPDSGVQADPWPRFPLLMALQQYVEAKNGDQKTLQAMYKFLQNLRSRLFQTPLSSWAQVLYITYFEF